MTPERMAELVGRWVRFYTRDLPIPIAQRRGKADDAPGLVLLGILLVVSAGALGVRTAQRRS